MTDYNFRYSLTRAPEARNDGSGAVIWDIQAVARADDAAPTDPWVVVPGRHKSVVTLSADLKTVNDMPNSPQGAKVQAFKQILVDNVQTAAPNPIVGWDLVSMEALLDANDASSLEAGRANEFITVTLGQSYPVTFSL